VTPETLSLSTSVGLGADVHCLRGQQEATGLLD